MSSTAGMRWDYRPGDTIQTKTAMTTIRVMLSSYGISLFTFICEMKLRGEGGFGAPTILIHPVSGTILFVRFASSKGRALYLQSFISAHVQGIYISM